jgi:hypothetical protein
MKLTTLVYRIDAWPAICPAGAFGHEMPRYKISISRHSPGTAAAHSARMTKLLKTVLIAGSLITSTAIVSFADAPKTADKAGAGSAAAGSASKGSASTKGSTTPAKGSGAGSAAKSGK